jgi:uncharacterized membrane protein YcaP (DUF421 family)
MMPFDRRFAPSIILPVMLGLVSGNSNVSTMRIADRAVDLVIGDIVAWVLCFVAMVPVPVNRF